MSSSDVLQSPITLITSTLAPSALRLFITFFFTSDEPEPQFKLLNIPIDLPPFLLKKACSIDLNLDNFLEHVGLVNENQKKIHHNSIKLMTLHAAKGLEFDHVYLPGWEEGIFPSSRALDQNSSKALEEERRLAYVGITRAKFDLNLSYASSRYTYGINNYSLPSRFLSEISDIEIDKSSILEDYNSNRENKLTSINDKDLSPGKKRMLEFLNKHKK